MSLITGGVLSRHPGLRIALSHGGGSFPALLARYAHAWKLFPGLREAVAENPFDLGRRLYFDSLVYDETLLRTQIRLFGISQTMIGSDYPFVIMERDPLARMNELAFSAEETELLLCANAMRWLGRDRG
jgi:aminocarboxymuconate-semialdehyde decarboxylase